VKKKGLEVCAECEEFPCSKFDGWTEDGEGMYDSFITYRKAMPNLMAIRKQGIEDFVKQQKKRIELLELILERFDDGRSKSFFCIVATLLPAVDLERALEESEEMVSVAGIGTHDVKARCGILRGILQELATRQGIEFKLRKKGRKSC
jgi:hypothetical protein